MSEEKQGQQDNSQAAQQTESFQETEPDYKKLYEEWKGHSRDHESAAKKAQARVKALEEELAKRPETQKSVEDRLLQLENENKAYKEQAARNQLVKDVAKATNVPETLVALLNGADEESLTEQAKSLSEVLSKGSTATVPVVLGSSSNETQTETQTADEFFRAQFKKIGH